MKNDPYVFLISDYFATGEGRTISGLITRAYPRVQNGGLITDRTKLAKLEMKERIGEYFMVGVEVVDREEFLERMENIVPQVVIEMIDQSAEQPGNFSWFGELHFNFS